MRSQVYVFFKYLNTLVYFFIRKENKIISTQYPNIPSKTISIRSHHNLRRNILGKIPTRLINASECHSYITNPYITPISLRGGAANLGYIKKGMYAYLWDKTPVRSRSKTGLCWDVYRFSRRYCFSVFVWRVLFCRKNVGNCFFAFVESVRGYFFMVAFKINTT